MPIVSLLARLLVHGSGIALLLLLTAPRAHAGESHREARPSLPPVGQGVKSTLEKEVDLESSNPLAIDASMARWARKLAPAEEPPGERLRRLSRALLHDPRARLEEIERPTFTARRAFSERRANCVAYAALFVGLAREMGIPAFFVRVDSPVPAGQQAGLEITEGHLAAAWGTSEQQWRIYDFAGETTLPPDRVEALTDLGAMALFASNRGVEALLVDQPGEATAWLEQAVELEPDLVEAWINLGVARRRLGHLADARRAYEEALHLDPGSVIAYRNLAVLLRLDGRQYEAREVLDLAEDLGHENALDFLDLANSSLRSGDLGTARGFYRRALKLSQRPQ